MRALNRMSRLAIVLVAVLAASSLAFVATVPPARADHDTIHWSDPFTVTSAPGFTYPESRIIADGRGYVYVFYMWTNIALSVTNLNVSKWSAVGPVGVPVKIADTPVNDVANVVQGGYPFSAAVDGSGNLYVAWTHVAGTGGPTIYVSKSSDGAASWDPAVLVSENSAGNNLWPLIATGPDGTVYVEWTQTWPTAQASTMAWSTDGGSTYSTPLNLTSTASIRSTTLAVDTHGRLYVGISSHAVAVTSYSVSVSWSDDGTTWAPWQTVSGSLESAIFPALDADSFGSIHLAWYSSIGSTYMIRYSESLDRGATWSVELPISSPFNGGYIGYLASEGDTVMYAWGDFSTTGFGFVISADHGVTWYPSTTQTTAQSSLTTLAADQNGTFWASYAISGGIELREWVGPPSRPVVESVARSGTDGLTVSWTAAPEQNVADYIVWRSTDGTNYQAVAVVGASVTSFTDTGLFNGTYWYKLTAVNDRGTSSHDSAAWSGTVGPSTQDLIDSLENQIAALRSALNSTNANLAAIQAQLDVIRAQLNSLQGNTTALENEVSNLQDQLNNLQSQQATQTISYANLAFEIIVVVLLVVLLLNQMRRPKQPQMMMAQPAQASSPAPKQPEDDL